MTNGKPISIQTLNPQDRTCSYLHLGIATMLLLACLESTSWGQRITLRDAPLVTFPAETDSNSPAHWSNGSLYLFNSSLSPLRSEGFDQFNLGELTAPRIISYPLWPFGLRGRWLGNFPSTTGERSPNTRWIEATWHDSDGTLYAWYHHEPIGVCSDNTLTAPQIGALRSTNNGAGFTDLGIILTAQPIINCDSRNGYFAGGNGDFSVIFEPHTRYFYFLFSTYAGEVENQGVAVARMAYVDRNMPKGKVYKFHNNSWREPGLGGRVTPILPAMADWMGPEPDAFWGPSVHWNTYLRKFVMLLNRSCCSDGWPQEGIYASYNWNIANPWGWSTPVKFMDGAHEPNLLWSWYPQVLGLNTNAQETDKLAGQVARFYLGGRSEWEIVFSKE